jgi:hypothetical protein
MVVVVIIVIKLSGSLVIWLMVLVLFLDSSYFVLGTSNLVLPTSLLPTFPPPLAFQPIFHHGYPMFCQYRFGMELKTADFEFFVPHTHDLSIGCSGGDFQIRGKCLFIDHPRMVSADFEFFGKAFEDQIVSDFHFRSKSVNYFRKVDQSPTKSLSDRLMSKTDAEDILGREYVLSNSGIIPASAGTPGPGESRILS